MPTPTVRAYIAAIAPDALPAYVYDLAALRTHAAAVRAALPEDVELYYAAKANPEPEILTGLARSVSGYEVSSGGELAHVRASVPHLPLAFGGPGKTPAEIAEALALGVERFHVESERELHLLAQAGQPADLLLRVNLPADPRALDGAALAMGGRPTPFGLDPDRADACLALLRTPGFSHLRLRGIHAHLASGLDADAQLALAESIVDWAVQRDVTEVNIGGGMAVDYTDPASLFDWPRFGTGLARILDRHPRLTLRIEPGRSLTAYCGWYATEALDLKLSHGAAFAVLRGGTHHLRTPAAKSHSQPFTILPVPHWPHPWPRPTVRDAPVTLTGQLCTPKDVLAHQVPCQELRAGDRVIFAMAGAYAWNISHHDFLMHPRPGFHFLR